MSKLEQKALKLRRSGVSVKEIEKRLGREFIYFEDPQTKEIVSVTLWK